MLVRNQQVGLCPGALVFPGGKVESTDGHSALRARCSGAESLSDDELRFRVAGIREVFEESGLLLARRADDSGLLNDAVVNGLKARWQLRLQLDATGQFEMLEAEDLHLATDLLEPFAHWVTPDFLDKRFDTRFFLAATPTGQSAQHDGGEAVDSLWITPHQALAEGEAGRLSRSEFPAAPRRRFLTPENESPWPESSGQGLSQAPGANARVGVSGQ